MPGEFASATTSHVLGGEERLVLGRYQLRRRIGAGAMATVYLAHDRVIGRDVAVKVLDAATAADPAFVAAHFTREARAAAALRHPNVVAVYDWGAVGTTYYLEMEY